jgi:hypothetical protein
MYQSLLSTTHARERRIRLSTTTQNNEDSNGWHLGAGTGAGAESANVNVSYVALGTSCLFQVTAEVFTASS